MRVFLALVRKQLVESRWVIGLMAAAFLVVAFLWTWQVSRRQLLVPEGQPPSREIRGLRVYGALGGPAMDFSTLAMVVACWNHPVIFMVLLGWTLARGSGAVADEIERGTLDLTLSRPVSRTAYLSARVGFDVLGVVVLALALVAGSLIAARVYHLKSPLSINGLARAAAMFVALGVSIYGYTLPFSAVDVVRWRSAVIGLGITIVGLVAMMLARLLEGYDWLEKLSVFRAYAPVTVAMKGEPLAFNSMVLLGIFAIGAAVSYVVFAVRDLPTNA